MSLGLSIRARSNCVLGRPIDLEGIEQQHGAGMLLPTKGIVSPTSEPLSNDAKRERLPAATLANYCDNLFLRRREPYLGLPASNSFGERAQPQPVRIRSASAEPDSSS